MFRKHLKFYLLFGALFFAILIFLNSAFAPSCWLYTTQASCITDNSCRWNSDSWGGSCQELTCWNLDSQSDCTTTNVPGKNCTWVPGATSWACQQLNCWGFSGTNANTCTNNSANLSCAWNNYCYSTGSSRSPTNCGEQMNQSSCSNQSGCAWGACDEKGCFGHYNTAAVCNAAKDWMGKNCTWNTNGNYCDENGCWKYNNQSACVNNTAVAGLNCEWKWNACQERNCWSWDYTNSSACVNNTLNLSCDWSGSYCMKQECWSYSSNATCSQKPKCKWKSYTSSGWCNEVNCFEWDGSHGNNNDTCIKNGTLYNLNCVWVNNPLGNLTPGWCYNDISVISCANKTTERECMDTYYCWWRYTDWNNPSAGGNCNDPSNFSMDTNASILNDWNPGCYTFDTNSSDCNNVSGCSYSNGQCDVNPGHANANEITTNGINCTMINSSQLCNSIPMLSSCCSWQNGTCATNKLSKSCWDQMTTPPAGASFCEDYNSYTSQALCEQIAGSPWYMPCKWNNSTARCELKASDVFGNETQSLSKIDNKKNCEAAGGKWITENYCEGNVSVPSGRCEYKFDEEENCDKACFACEIKDSDGNSVNATNAPSACSGSKLGRCEFSANANAPNGIGYCKAKEQFKKGIAGSCDSNCGDCTHKGDTTNNDTTKRPSYYCTTSKANSDGGGCKWIADNSTLTGGYCVDKGEKTCEDACDRCKTQNDCSNVGRSSVTNKSGSCKWQGDANTGGCVSNTGEEVEVCWDGIDNNDNNIIDCADPSCYADSYCGFVEGDCFGWQDNTSCITHNCEWVTDKWGSWCDFKGSQCWIYDVNETTCNNNTNCQWSNGTSSNWCEQDWSKSELCMGLNRDTCMLSNTSGCNWTVDSWCLGLGNGTDWCKTSGGGWCDYENFKPKDCWMYTSGSQECNSNAGCGWRTDEYSQPHCEVNWSGNCWQFASNETCSNAGCWWRSDTWGGWCNNAMDKCWQGAATSASCNSQRDSNGNAICYWDSWGNFCQPLCFNGNNAANLDNCRTTSGCVWKEQNGWCEDSGMAACSNSTNTNNIANCQTTTGCRWRSSGWCDPKGGGFSGGAIAGGGGVGTAVGADCYKYDGNQTLCTNRTLINISCGWSAETNAKCDVNWGQNCWQYPSVEAGCTAGNGCWLRNDTFYGATCMNVMDQCWNNMSFQGPGSSAACNATNLCSSTPWGGCEPTCFSQTTSNSCTAGALSGKCKWVTGWCNPSGMNEMFTGMESGAPVPLGMDNCNEGIQSSIDICGFGMKDMGDSYGFGMNVRDFSNASICNKEKLSSFVMAKAVSGGGPGPGPGPESIIGTSSFGAGSGLERIGDGNETVVVVVYLDTDGSTTGGCSLSHNASSAGYEFRFKYSSEWNANTSKATETFNAYTCDESTWKAADIKLSAWKKKMCAEIGGPMIAVKKADLEKFPILYDSTKDIRVSVSSIGNAGNITDPSDAAGPGWATPGAIDFEIANAFGYGADSSKFEDILKKGFVEYEDCFNGMDDNGDGNIDCNDWSCQYSSKCAGIGVNAQGYADTKSPQVTGVKIEEYPDAALVMYDTNKPANGTLELYGADSTCLNITDKIYDIGVLKNNTIREFKLWHYAAIYWDKTNETINGKNVSLNYPLASSVTYYYKLKVCDNANKCAVSKCSSFRTPNSTQKCGYCNFITRLIGPSGWTWVVSYDVNRDWTYEHVQGQVCGPNAGMKTNYTAGRRVNVRLAKSDGSVYMEFLNVTLTKTGLNDKVRNITSQSSLIYNTTEKYVGMPSETRDKIINNLHPEVCRIKIPFTGTCDTLYHCDDSGINCTDRTAAAGGAPIDAVNCVWNVPFCEFSTYKESTTTTTTTTSSSSGGGGGGGGGGGTTYEVDLSTPVSKELAVGDKIKFKIDNANYTVSLGWVAAGTAALKVSLAGGAIITKNIKVGESSSVDVNGDSKEDIQIAVVSVNTASLKATIEVKLLSAAVSEIPTPTGEVIAPIKEKTAEQAPQEQAKKETGEAEWLKWAIISAAAVAVLFIASAIILQRTRRK